MTPGSRNSVSGSDWIWFRTRAAIYLRDGNRCLACRSRQRKLSLDHVIPRRDGGSNRPENLITLCVRCNSERGARPLGEWRHEMPARAAKQIAIPLDRERARALADDMRPTRIASARARWARGPLAIEGCPF